MRPVVGKNGGISLRRVRLGQSKISYGYENMQSSQIRILFDRNDAPNSAFSNE